MLDHLNKLKKNSMGIIAVLIIALLTIVILGGAGAYQYILPTESPESSTPTHFLAQTTATLFGDSEDENASDPALNNGNIPGLNPAEAVLYLEDRQFACKDVKESRFEHEWYCQREDQDILFEVGIFTKTMETIDLIDANIHQTGETSDETAINLLQSIIEMPYISENKNAAIMWMEETLPGIRRGDDIREVKFGDIHYRLYGEAQERSLEIGTLGE